MSQQADLSIGSMDYVDTGTGPVIVFLHGVFMDASLWAPVIAKLSPKHRCVAPTLPLGAHRRPAPATADLSPGGVAVLVEEFLERLDLSDVTLVGGDTGGAIAQLVATRTPERIKRLGLVACDAFENFPPGLPGRTSALSARMPGGLLAAAHAMRVRPFARLPLAWGWMAKHGLTDEQLNAWFVPLRASPGVRHDLARFLRAVDKTELDAASKALANYHRPALIAWSEEDRVMPPEHARQLAQLLPQAHLEWLPDSYTLISLDQPERLAAAIADFIATT